MPSCQLRSDLLHTKASIEDHTKDTIHKKVPRFAGIKVRAKNVAFWQNMVTKIFAQWDSSVGGYFWFGRPMFRKCVPLLWISEVVH